MTFEEYVQKHLGVSGMSFEDMELVGLGWAAHRDHGSCSEIPNSSDHAKEAKGRIEGDKSGYGRIADPALEGKPVYVLLSHNPDSPESTFVEIETEAGVSVSVPWHLYDGFSRVGPLYTHPASADVPEGWKLVPVEISHDMEQAGCQAYMDADGPGTLWMHASSMDHAYKAMIDAAPCRPEPAKADEQASVPDKRPSNCREKARQDGGSYPKSGCFSCGNSWLFNGCPHSHKQESAQ